MSITSAFYLRPITKNNQCNHEIFQFRKTYFKNDNSGVFMPKTSNNFFSNYENILNNIEDYFKNLISKKSAIDNEEVKQTENDISDFIEEKKDDIPDKLKSLWEDFLLVYAMIKDHIHGNFTVNKKALIIAVLAMAYVISPLDLIPDFIPVAGFLDDAALFSYAINLISDEISRYKQHRLDS